MALERCSENCKAWGISCQVLEEVINQRIVEKDLEHSPLQHDVMHPSNNRSFQSTGGGSSNGLRDSRDGLRDSRERS